MKKKMSFIVCSLMILFSSFTNAQQNVSDKMYHELKGMDEVTYMAFSKSMMDFVDLDFDDDDCCDGQNVTGDLNEVKLAIYKPEENSKKDFRDMVKGFLKKGKYEKIEDDDMDEDSEVWVNRKGKKIYECHVIFQGDKNGVLLSFYGDFKLEDVEKFKKKVKDYE